MTVETMTNQMQYEEASWALQSAAEQIEEALNWLAACGNEERREELSHALGIVQGVNAYVKAKANES
jgi:hypothetical protein